MRTLPILRTLLLLLALPLPAPGASDQTVWNRLKQAAREVPRPAAAQPSGAAPGAAAAGSSQKASTAAASQGFTPTAETGTPQLTASLASAAGFLDVNGVRLGMKAGDALAVLHSHNGLLKITQETYTHELIPGQTLVSGIHAQVPLVAGQIFERFEIALSTQPSDSYVMAVAREVHYPPGKQPTYTSAIEGMRSKYGKENFVPRAAPTGPGFFWILDQQGHPVQGPELERIVTTCTSPFLVQEWQSAVHTVTLGYEEQKHSIGALRCSSYATVAVYFQGSLIPGQTTYLLDNLTVVASNGALYRSAVEATHAQYLSVQKKVDSDKMNKADRQKVDF
jgi:hypothetical protein